MREQQPKDRICNKSKLGNALLTACALGMFSTSFADTLSIDQAINKAGKQRMITQRILKDYALVGMNTDLGNPAADLKNLIEEFNTTLAELQDFSSSKALDASLADTKAQWNPIKAKLQKSPSKTEAAVLQQDLDKLLGVCNQNTQLIAKSANNKKGDIVNLAGKQRMLSQRMAALYMLKAWKLDDPRFREKLDGAMNDFAAAQRTLEASPLTTDEIHALLAKVKRSYAWFEMMGKSSSNRVIPNLINKSANSILADMDTVTSLYANTASKQ